MSVFIAISSPLYAGDNLLKKVSYSSVTELAARTPDRKIAYAAEPLQYGLLWLPAAQQKNPPLAVFIHGDCWLNADDIQHSYAAGGQLALLAGGKVTNASGVIGLVAISDFETYSQGKNGCQTAEPKFIGRNYAEKTTAYAQANPSKQALHVNS